MNTSRTYFRLARIFVSLILAGVIALYSLSNANAKVQLSPFSWFFTGPLNMARYRHTATLLPNGKVLVIGGQDDSPNPVGLSELYDPVTRVWDITDSLNIARYDHTATLLPNGQVLVVGGSGGLGAAASAELYDPSTGTWILTTSMNAARWAHTATLLPNGKVLVTGGGTCDIFTDGGVNSSVELYDPATGLWTLTGSMHDQRYGHTATLLANGKVLVVGGVTKRCSALTSAELYDPATGIWTSTGSMPFLAYYHTASLLPDGRVLVAGGVDWLETSPTPYHAVLYDPVTGTWTPTGSLNTPRRYHTATVLPNGEVVVVGGGDPSGYVNAMDIVSSTELYNPGAGTWTTLAPLHIPRTQAAASLFPTNLLLIAGGNDGYDSLFDPYHAIPSVELLQIPFSRFNDVSVLYWATEYIERLYKAGVTGGCGTNPLIYCPVTVMTRDQMAVFLLRGKHGSSYVPPTATGVFQDVPVDYWAADWIEQLAAEGITNGCGDGNYCPTMAVTRDQMAVFLLKAKHGSSYVPPAATGVFQDVPTNYWAADWIEQLAAEGVTGGCSTTPIQYCPTAPVTRDQMAVFLVRNFNLP